MAGWGLTILRIAVGIVFIAHGAQKLFGAFGGTGLSGTSDYYSHLGLNPSYPMAMVFGVIEFACGVLMFLGAWTRWVAVPLALSAVVLVWKAHFANGFFINWGMTPGIGHGYEFSLVLIAACVGLAMEGGGELSIDRLMHRNAESTLAGRHRASRL